jgi:hypothetical protein
LAIHAKRVPRFTRIASGARASLAVSLERTPASSHYQRPPDPRLCLACRARRTTPSIDASERSFEIEAERWALDDRLALGCRDVIANNGRQAPCTDHFAPTSRRLSVLRLRRETPLRGLDPTLSWNRLCVSRRARPRRSPELQTSDHRLRHQEIADADNCFHLMPLDGSPRSETASKRCSAAWRYDIAKRLSQADDTRRSV